MAIGPLMAAPVIIVNATFKIVQHDLVPALPFWFFEPDGVTPLDLTLATGVEIVVTTKQADTATIATAAKFRKPCVLLDKPNGHGEYQWSATDTDVPGAFSYQFKILWPGSPPKAQTVPVDSYLDLLVLDDLT